jgi:hypothetical protein
VSNTSLRRLGCYVVVLGFRGWFLYVALNALEGSLVGRNRRRETATITCWYEDWLRDDQPRCAGRAFDFSDHIVLYYGQILPIALVEFLHALEFPYWTTTTTRGGACFKKQQHADYYSYSLDRWLLPCALWLGMIYLYFITFVGVYKTAAFFHTGPEVMVGFLVSMFVYVPLSCIQCSVGCEQLREFLFATNLKVKQSWLAYG